MVYSANPKSSKGKRSNPRDGKRWNIGNNSAGDGSELHDSGPTKKKIETVIMFRNESYRRTCELLFIF